MAVTVAEIMTRAAYVLNDALATPVRWTAQEMLLWINDGQREIVLNKPSANTDTVAISLAAGTEQAVPATATQLVQILRNTDGAAITMVERDDMDQHVPGWADETIWPQQAIVEHAIYDPQQPDVFDVFPPNDGNGEIDAVVSVRPNDIAAPGSNAEQIASYSANIGLSDDYRVALTEYLLYRAFSKDAEYPAAAQRAMAHYQLFAAAIGMKTTQETRMNPDRTQGG
jgi:hypothetical protein